MSFISYTIFADVALTQVRQVANLFGSDAERALRAFRNIKGSDVAERDVICGCRIDRIGSECQAEA